ncbi:ABC transporter substrate-binding protein [Pseudomonas japonica]|uniref:Peptide/nickel transport system substrate-binding protein n=1 Tax=Pseudomonas japonica TaxID=256466 RepID=A0A239BNG3_9PSED|nr:ABC transporter substrate-binding protein [Pseudomonas japonica]SNS08574.1 peptide/nickel transport system substrate-binding protein [Pseudomonas japonica]
MRNEFSRRVFLGNSLAVGGGLLLGSSLLSGCGSGDPAAVVSSAVPGIPVRGGRLRVGIIDGDQAGNLDAHKPSGGGIIRGWALYSKFWEWNDDVSTRLGLAEFAEPNADASAWTVRIRPGLEFHNGKTITSDDMLFSILRLTDPKLASPYAGLVGAIDRQALRKLDDRTIEIRFKEGRSFFPLDETLIAFGGIVPTDYDPNNPVGAGPYRLKRFVPGQRALFTRFENYFKPNQPYADELEIIEFKDQVSRVAALRAGQIDIASGIQAEHSALIKADPRLQLVASPTTSFSGFNLNTAKAPFQDERVRQAFRLLADRQELVGRGLNGFGRVANDLYSPQDPTYNHAIAQRPYDLDQARSLLRQAGASDLRLELTTTANEVNAALVFAQQAKKAGIEIKVTPVDNSVFNGPQKEQWLVSPCSTPARGFLATGLHNDAPLAIYNRSNFRDERFSQLFTQALGQPDLALRRELVHEAQTIQHQRGGLLIWGFTDVLDAASNKVGGLHGEQTTFASWRFDSLWLNHA